MSQPNCSCASFERLEGASVTAYIKAFLEQTGHATPEAKNRYRCRVCGREWEKRAPEIKSEGTRPSLIRIGQ
jgi:NAD dependent epimerase/dehydratase family enzyme